MTELEHLNADLRLAESLYAAAKMRDDHLAAKLAAEDMARVNHLFVLLEQQEAEEKKP